MPVEYFLKLDVMGERLPVEFNDNRIRHLADADLQGRRDAAKTIPNPTSIGSMTDSTIASADNPFDLNRFVRAQAAVYSVALAELKAGCKRSHWMWFIFPQIDGLGFSETTKRYSIKSLAEARAYLAHPLLGTRLIACTEALLALDGRSAREIFGRPDDRKLQSSMTLFACISPAASGFSAVLDRYFGGVHDQRTVELIAE